MNTRAIDLNNGDQLMREGAYLTITHFVSGLLLMILIVGLFIWSGITLMRPDVLPIRNVRVEGEFRQLSPDRLEAIVIDTVRGGFFNVNVDDIQEVLLVDPWVKSVTVKRNWPDSLTVQVTEQVAVAQWGGQGLINTDGELFRAEVYTFPVGLPVLVGPEDTHRQMLAQLNRFQEIMSSSGFSISELSLNDRRSWAMQLSAGPLLILGKRNISTRVERFTTYVTTGLAEVVREMEAVDFRYPNGFAIRWKYNSNHSELGQDYHG